MYGGEEFGNSVSVCSLKAAACAALTQFASQRGFAKHNPTFGSPLPSTKHNAN